MCFGYLRYVIFKDFKFAWLILILNPNLIWFEYETLTNEILVISFYSNVAFTKIHIIIGCWPSHIINTILKYDFLHYCARKFINME